MLSEKQFERFVSVFGNELISALPPSAFLYSYETVDAYGRPAYTAPSLRDVADHLRMMLRRLAPDDADLFSALIVSMTALGEAYTDLHKYIKGNMAIRMADQITRDVMDRLTPIITADVDELRKDIDVMTSELWEAIEDDNES